MAKLLGTDEPFSAPTNWDDPPDNEAAQDALTFIKSCPATVDGIRVNRGDPLGSAWLRWEDKLVRHLFGTLTEDNRTRKYRTVYCEMPKKTGKSHLAAAIALYCLIADDEYGGQVYSAGFNQKQAKVVWEIALDMARIAPWLKKRLDLKEYRNQILCPPMNGKYEPLTSQDLGQHGFNPSAVIFDELHTQKNREMYDTIDRSMVARREPLLFAITNAGVDRESVCYSKRKYAIQVNEGSIEDERFLGLIYAADPEHGEWTEPETWKRANPSLGVTVPLERVREDCESAQAEPSAQNSFKRWSLSIWTQASERWIKPDDWDDCYEPFDVGDLRGHECYGAIDVGAVDDLTAWALIFPDPDDRERVRVVCRAWCPEARLYDRSNPYRQQYQAWARGGWLSVVRGSEGKTAEVMGTGPVKNQVLEDASNFGLVDLAVDQAFQGNHLMIELSDEGLEVVGMKTTYNHMTSPCDELERRVRHDPPLIRHNGNPVLAWAMSNVALKNPDPDRKRPVQDTKHAKIDPVVAMLMALDRAMRHSASEQRTAYEDHDMMVL